MLPYLAVVPAISNALEGPAYGGDYTEDTCSPVTAAKNGDCLYYSRGSSAWDAKYHVNGEEEVPSAEEEIDVIVQCLLLHVTIVNGSVPQQEREWCDEYEIPDAGAQSTAAIFCTSGEVYDAGDHVEEQRGAEDQPQLEEAGDQRTGCFRNLIGDRMVDERVEWRKVVSSVFLYVIGLLGEFGLSPLEIAFALRKLFDPGRVSRVLGGVIEGICVERVG